MKSADVQGATGLGMVGIPPISELEHLRELAKLLRDHDDEDPMKDYVIEQQREKVKDAVRKWKDQHSQVKKNSNSKTNAYQRRTQKSRSSSLSSDGYRSRSNQRYWHSIRRGEGRDEGHRFGGHPFLPPIHLPPETAVLSVLPHLFRVRFDGDFPLRRAARRVAHGEADSQVPSLSSGRL